ncbi:MAG: hypothetical protein JWP05_934, partial [Microbacteriaceae bacterium]|nr:hypothetical protein [Microbacteriaceae bacterium]
AMVIFLSVTKRDQVSLETAASDRRDDVVSEDA